MAQVDYSPEIDIVPDPRQSHLGLIRWGKSHELHRLTCLGAGPDVYDLPGKEVLVSSHDLKAHSNMLVMSERSGGTRGFLAWWRDQLSQEKLPWIQITGSGWSKGLYRISKDLEATLSGSPAEAIPQALHDLGHQPQPHDKATALFRLAELVKPGTGLYLILRDIEDPNDGPPEAFARALRLFREEQSHAQTLKITIASTSDHALFIDYYHGSGYLAMCQQYRMPFLNQEELSKLAQDEINSPALLKRVDFSDSALAYLLDLTGGQPLLSKTAIHSLRQALSSDDSKTEITDSDLHAVWRKLRLSPPPATHTWVEDLRRLLSDRPDLEAAMRAYVAGKTLSKLNYPPPSKERPLMISGWLRENRLGRWGITSKIHRELAAQVLLDQTQHERSQGRGAA